jgi:hypothetical protein
MPGDRGSSKLGATAESLEKALAAAQVSYKIERWWKYGQPAVDLVKGVINVTNVADAGKVLQHLISLQGKLQVGIEVFPYGIINPDGVRINVNIDEHAGGA